MAQEIYHRSNWGNPTETWGNVYLNADLTNELYKRASEYENSWVTDQLLNGVGTKPSIILTPTAYEDGVLNSVKPAKTFGSELMPSIATIENNNGGIITQINGNSYSSTSDGTSSSSIRPKFDFATTSGKTYKLVITPIGTVTGTVNFDFYDGSTYLFQNYDFTSTKEITFTDNVGVFGAFDGTQTYSISNFTISIKEVTEADFDFTRGSSATRVNEQGLVEDVQILSGELVQNGNFEQIGSELVVNGGFDTDTDWIKGTGWSISGGKGVATNTSSYIKQNSVVTNNKIFKVTFDAIVTSGRFRLVTTADASTYTSYITADGSYTFYMKPTVSINGGFEFVGDGFTGSIDNVSVKEVGQNWTLTSGATIEDGQLVLSASANLYQSIPLTVGKKYRVKYEITSIDAGSSGITVYGGSTSGTRREEVGTYTEDIIQSGSGLLFFFTGGGFNSGTIDNVSVVEVTDDTDLPRINYIDGEGSLLLEPQSTNLITYSEDLSEWIAADITVTDNNSTSPDGSQNASKLELNSGTRIKRILLGSMPTSAVTRAYSVFVKADSDFTGAIQLVHSGDLQGFANFDLSDGTVGTTGSKTTANIVNYSNGWYRCTAIFDSSNTFGSSIYLWMQDDDSSSYGGSTSATGSVFAYGFQYEQGSYATSYIPTNGSTVTRLADVCNNSGNSDLINSTEGVLYAEISALADDLTNRSIALTDGSTNNRVNILYASSSNQIRVIVVVGGSTKFDTNYSVTSIQDNHKIALKYKADDFALWIDGVERATDTSGTIYPQNTLDELAFNVGSGAFPFYGNVKCVAVFKEALSDTELEKLTTI